MPYYKAHHSILEDFRTLHRLFRLEKVTLLTTRIANHFLTVNSGETVITPRDYYNTRLRLVLQTHSRGLLTVSLLLTVEK